MGDKNRQSKTGKTSAGKTAKAGSSKSGPVDWPGCQLMLTVMPGPGARDMLAAVLEASGASAVLIRPAPEENLGAGEVKPLVDLAQEAGVAAIIFDDVRLARTLRADGVHIAFSQTDVVADVITEARATLGQAANIGIDAGISRHRAMEAGEGGADYVAFGAAEGTLLAQQVRNELIAWWADIFEVPCVALDVKDAADAGICDAQGADFVALVIPAGMKPERAAAFVADVEGSIAANGQE